MKTFILATALAAMIVAPAAAAPGKGQSGRGNSEHHERWDRDDRRGNDRRDDHRDYRGGDRRDDRGPRGGRGIPPGHIPPAGQCRVWFDDRPPGHQPRATSCREARATAHRYGGRVIVGGRR
ncbi:hypothetical protein PK98_07980 [Croceibacterium mercuriale]|uniref:Uncharacterized protein n=1 Tax=Croceibacterium mercuriale TaxID=1572751 RepID=A0A0B2C2J7_9SPHN|nr:hypothetical protein [Croceibacterium mercuriale]KHL26380.1 hypothetical protein PK98_07980 [Croceibacterium mercuriale]